MKFVRNIFKSTFFRNFSSLFVGSSLSQMVPILISPILTRLFSPVEFGVYALFFSLCTVLSHLTTLRYEYAILKSESKEEVEELVTLISSLVFVMSVLVLLLIHIVFGNFVTADKFSFVLENQIQIAIFVFMVGLNKVFNIYYTYLARFGLIAVNSTVLSVGTGFANLIFGVVKKYHSVFGLILGAVIGRIIANLLYIKKLEFDFMKTRKNLNFSLFKKYIDFPKYSLWGALLDDLAIQIPNYNINYVFEKSLIGQFSLTNRILITPFSFISSALSQLYLKDFSSLDYSQKSINRKLIMQRASLMFLFSIPFVVLILFYGREIFSFVFGSNWSIAGEISKILIIPIALRFVVSPLSSVLLLNSKNYIALIWQALYFISMLTVFFVSFSLSFNDYISLYAIVNCFMYIVYLVLILVYV